MSALSDNEDDIVAEYENRASEDDLGNASDADNEGRNEDEAEETKGRRIDPATSRSHVANPQPKLNTERLKGPKGIHTIEKYFEGFKFHGKGREKADLDRVMKRIEHWAHRLFPKLEYNDFLSRLEVLGSKKDLQVFIKKYRMDMISVNENEISTEIIEEEEEKEEDSAPVDEFDILIAEQIQKQKQATMQQKTLNNSASEEAFNRLLPQPASQSSQPVKESNPPSQLNDEVKARIERNRQQALERKMARLKQREEEAKKQKLEETGSVEVSQETMNDHTTKEQEENNSITNEKEDISNENKNTITD